MWAIMGASVYGVEEIDSFETRKEALAMLAEYRLAFNGSMGALYLKRVAR